MTYRVLADAVLVLHLAFIVFVIVGGLLALRRAVGAEGYSGGFIEHYLLPIIYPAGLTPSVQLTLAALAVTANLLVYSLVCLIRRRR